MERSTILKDNILHYAEAIYNRIVEDRHHLHAHPELSFNEERTSAYIKRQLDELGLKWSPCAKNGVVSMIKGHLPSDDVVAIRADIDALPIQEKTAVPYRSVYDGVMHACGHDVHTASLLGVIRILNLMKYEFKGTVKFLFQPAEEKFPGGAADMVRDGALQSPAPLKMLAQHVMPELPSGKIGIKDGLYAASNDEVFIKIYGKGGHGSQPDVLTDPVTIAAQVITALQQIVSRKANPTTPTVLSFGKIIANGATNIIPDEVYLEGTLRTFDPHWRATAHQQIKKVTRAIVEGFDGACDIKIQGFPNVFNDPAFSEQVRGWAREFLGEDNVVDLPLWMAGEDFGEYTTAIPGCYYRIGVGNQQKNIGAPLHNANFDIDEQPVLQLGSSLMAFVALRSLGN